MPHLAFETFVGQVFWLVICFAALYYLAANFLLPSVAQVVDARAKKISDDIKTAEQAKDNTILAQETHATLIAKATAEARKTLDEALKKTEANIDLKRKELQEKIDKSLSAAEKKISLIEQESATVVGKVSGDIAKIMAQKVAA
jgi:F-type H+-transporting ATPase subunit b